MSYLLVESFSQGVDVRRSILASKPGTLRVCKNAHITRGGEIEKRKAFVSTYILPTAQTFGAHGAKGTLYVFGSAPSVAVPAGVTYQRLQHPGGSPMTALLDAENFNGKVYAIAQFADGTVYHYYDGTRVTAWDSIIPVVADNSGIAAAFAAQIDLAAGFSASAAANVVTVTADANNRPFNIVTSALIGPNPTAVKTTPAGVSTAEVWTITISATFNSANILTANITANTPAFDETYIVAASSSGIGRIVKTFKTKMYSGVRSLLYFSQVNAPTIWNTNVNGSGFINMANQDAGSEDLTALASYQGKLAVFSRTNIQIWSMDPDPLKNVQGQILNNIGTRAPKSVVNYGDVDAFFLADSGIRSIKARDASNAAAVSDIGVYIDDLVLDDIRNQAEVNAVNAVGIIEPQDGRYMLAIGEKVYVYTFFPTPNISAWSTYEPGFTISDFAYVNGRLYARSGDTIYTYGGNNGNTYDDSEVEIILPFLDAGKPAHNKQYMGFDAAADGAWAVWANFDTSNLAAYDKVSEINGPTYDQGRMLGAMQGTHIGLKLIHKAEGYARISNLAIHYKGGEEDKS